MNLQDRHHTVCRHFNITPIEVIQSFEDALVSSNLVTEGMIEVIRSPSNIEPPPIQTSAPSPTGSPNPPDTSQTPLTEGDNTDGNDDNRPQLIQDQDPVHITQQFGLMNQRGMARTKQIIRRGKPG
jgi:hypothetical protein